MPSGFDRFGLHSPILRGVLAAGFLEPRPIQDETIPAALAGRDVLGLAETGTGKTAAFALPLLDRFSRERRPGPRALVLAPTRELATQIHAEILLLACFTRLQAVTIYGGVSARGQIQALRRNPEIVVGCPGRILDLIGQGVLCLGGVESLVLDEADHMFDMGFLPDVRRILAALPPQRQNLLFSATMPAEIRALADGLLRDPQVVELSRPGPAQTIEHALVPVREDRKHDLLERILAEEDCESAIVFTRTKHRARRLAKQLDQAGHRAVALQGNMSQSQRDRAMEGFRKRRFDVLVATDIAARGIDVAGVSYVICFGYEHDQSDLTCEDYRSRDRWWDYCRYMLEFFDDNNVPFWEMQNDNAKSTASEDYCFFKLGEVYVVYLKQGGTTQLDLSADIGEFSVRWYDPRNGGDLKTGSVTDVAGEGERDLGRPPSAPSEDWVVLVRRKVAAR